MIFQRTPLDGAWVVRIEPSEDERGFFGRTFCAEEFRAHGLTPCLAQASISYAHVRGTLRGLHWQAVPHREAKLVRCTRGRLFDVIVDLRPDSATRNHWFAIELSPDGPEQLYVPEGFAHGFQTLEDRTEVFYQISVPYAPEFSHGCHYASPSLGIEWPLPVTRISERDRQLDPLSPSGTRPA
jgi:dTDP-4-dehydrorhamnose 3,5-epimerase